MSRPALHGAGGVFGRSGATAVIILDNSYSMGLTDGATTRFAQAQKAAEELIDSLPPASSVAVLLASDVADELIGEPSTDLDLARRIGARARAAVLGRYDRSRLVEREIALLIRVATAH